MALKVDLSKAFNRVEWDFLLAILGKMRFGDLWCNWTCICITTYELEFMVNGDSVEIIKPQRGIRQRYPISTYLFIIVADVLSRQISRALYLGILSGIKMARNFPLISHIFFADDSLFFLKASHAECGTLISILNSYCEASGQTVNFQKSSAFFSPNTSSSLRDDICGDLHVHQIDPKAKYLGLPFIFGQKKAEMFGFLLDRVLQKMKGWKQKILSQLGREVLIKSVIQAIPTYAMQCFILPSSLLNKLTAYVRRFFRGGAFLLNKGGGFLSIPVLFGEEFSKGYIFRTQIFLLLKKDHTRLGFGAVYFTAAIFCYKVLDGKSETGEAFHPGHKIFDFIEDGHWNVRKLREHISGTEAEMVLQIPISQTGSSDKLIWHFNPKGQYTVKSGYKQAFALMSTSVSIGESSANPSSKFWKVFWHIPVQPKIKLFLWKAISNSVATKENLFRRNCSPSQNSSVAFGIVARDSASLLRYVIGNRCHAVSPLHAEIIAVHAVCLLASNHGWFNAIVESDSQIAISLSSLDMCPPWSLAALVEDIRIWAKNMRIRFSWVNRERNQVAH
ncbi:reverse transcriptase [Tanacetum coccineum]